jgi:hypothetical protein
LIQINVGQLERSLEGPMWHFIAIIDSVLTNRRVHLAVIDKDGVHPLEFPCYRIEDSWIHAETKAKIDVHPTHWRDWSEQ